MAEPRRRGEADPLKKLRKAALKTIREKGEQIADKLLELTLEGDITCAKFLIALIENAPPPDPEDPEVSKPRSAVGRGAGMGGPTQRSRQPAGCAGNHQ